MAAIGPVSGAVRDRPPFGPIEHLDHDRLVAERQATSASPRHTYSLWARLLLAIIDRLYGEERTLERFRVLDPVARVPYQAWENVAYVVVTHTAREPGFARRVFDRVRTARWEQDEEQWHLLVCEELSGREGGRRSLLVARAVPKVLAFAADHQLSWLLYVVRPAWSDRLNAGEYASQADLFRQIGDDERLRKAESAAAMAHPRFG